MKYAIIFNHNLGGQRIVEGIARVGRKIKISTKDEEIFGARHVVSFLDAAPGEKCQRNIRPDYVFDTKQAAILAIPAAIRFARKLA